MNTIVSNQARVISNQASVISNQELAKMRQATGSAAQPVTDVWLQAVGNNGNTIIAAAGLSNPVLRGQNLFTPVAQPSYANWGTYQASRERQQEQERANVAAYRFYNLFAALNNPFYLFA